MLQIRSKASLDTIYHTNTNDRTDPETRRALLNHRSTKEFDKSYASNIVDVDAFSEFSGNPSSTEYVETIRSMDHRRDRFAPQRLPAKLLAEFENHPDVEKHDKEIEKLTREINGDPQGHAGLVKDRQTLYNKKRGLKRSSTHGYRYNWFEGNFERQANQQLESKEADDDEPPNISSPANTFSLIRRFMPARDRLANLSSVTADLDSAEGLAALKDIVSLCIDDPQVAYRPEEYPIDGRCPYNSCSVVVVKYG